MSTSIVFCDEHSLDRTTDYLVSFEDGSLGERYPTPYETFRRLRDEARQAKSKTASFTPKQPSPVPAALHDAASTNRPRKLSWKEQRELEQLEIRVADLEVRKQILAANINEAGADFARMSDLATQLEAVDQALQQAEARWLELSEIAEG